jgi:hypothetical protein
MNTTISWTDFDGDRFQRLGNSIVYTLVSKRARLYTAPGKDGGIDQLYTGTWAGLFGKFRFQDKFRNAGKAADLSQLKKDIRDDIENHATDEDYIIYLTNVDLLPQEEKALEAIALKALKQKGRDTHTSVIFWHHAILEAMIITCPIILHQFFSTGDALLDHYLTYFKSQLSSSDLRYQLANRFIGRRERLRQLSQFLDRSETTLVITGPGNMGKTRLTLQFFQQVIDADEEWLALVLKPEGFSASSFSSLLAYERKMVILLDDAHKYPQILNSIKNEVDNNGGRIKLILTTRNNQLSLVKRAIAGHARNLAEIRLDRLDPVETMEVYRSLLPGHSEENLQFLRHPSNGLPGVIVTDCYHILLTGDPYHISADENFIEIIRETVEQAVQSVTAETGLSPRPVHQLIQLVSLIGPIKPTAGGLGTLSDLLGSTQEDIQAIGRSLEKTGLLAFREAIAILSDPVSDTILRNLCLDNPAWIKKIAQNPISLPFIENIVTNLAVHDTSDDPDIRFVDQLLEGYINGIIAPDATEDSIRSIFHTAITLSFRLPKVSTDAIDRFLIIWQNPHHLLQKKGALESQCPLERLKGDLSQVLARLIHGSTLEGAPGRYFPLFLRCVTILDHPNLVHPCFGFTPFDFETSWPRTGDCCAKQLFLADTIADYFVSDDPTEVAIALAAFESLYVHDFITRQAFDPYTNAIITGQCYVPNCSHIRRLRVRLIEGLIQYHRKHLQDEQPPDHWAEVLARVFLFFYPSRGKTIPVDQTEELTLVTTYFSMRLSGDASVTERALIARFLHIDDRISVKPALEAEYQAIDNLLSSGSRERRLELFLSSVDHNSERRHEQLERLVNEFPDIVEFVDAVKRLISSNDQLDVCALNELAHFLGKNYPDHARDLFCYAIDYTPAYVPCLSPIVDFLIDDEEEFFSIIEKVWKLGSNHQYDYSVIGMLLGYRRRTENRLNIRDLDYIPWAISDGSHTSRNGLGFNLHLYADLDPDRTFLLLRQLSKDKGAVGYIIHSMCRDRPFCLRHKENVLNLFRQILSHEGLTSNEFRPAMQFIGEYQGREALFAFITDEARIRSEANYYTLRNGRLWYSDDYAQQCELFEAYFSWIASYPRPLIDRIRKELLQFFLPIHPRKPADKAHLGELFGSMIDEYSDPECLKLLSQSIQGFYPYDPCTLALQCRLTDKFIALYPADANPDDLIGGHFVGNIEVGKQGVRGRPFPQDLEKAKFLRDFMATTTVSAPIADVLSRSLAKVDSDIAAHDQPPTWGN